MPTKARKKQLRAQKVVAAEKNAKPRPKVRKGESQDKYYARIMKKKAKPKKKLKKGVSAFRDRRIKQLELRKKAKKGK